MKSLSSALLSAQKKPSGLPAVSLTARAFGHPQKAGGSSGLEWEGLYPGLFNWKRLYQTDTISPTYHGLAIPSDGSLNRVRMISNHVYHQRIASPSPSSNFGAAWTDLIGCNNTPLAIAAYENKVAVVIQSTDLVHAWFKESLDNGQTWQDVDSIGNSCGTAIAVCYETPNDVAVFGSAGGTQIWCHKKVGGSWWGWLYTYNGSYNVYWLAAHWDGDYNVIALVDVGGVLKIARLIFGDGYRCPINTWDGYEFPSLGSANVQEYALIDQYYDKPYNERVPLPVRRPRPPKYSGRTRGAPPREGERAKAPWEYSPYDYYVMSHAYPMPPTGLNVGNTGQRWTARPHIYAARAIDNLELDAPYVCKPSGAPAILSVYKNGEKWFYRIRPGTDFYDQDWQRSHHQTGSCTYGLAIASDGNYLWGTRANEVWRSNLPMNSWPTPTAGAGASAQSQAIAQADVIELEETIKPMARSELKLVLDNSEGDYAALPSEHIAQGAQVEFAPGYGAELAPANKYFIEHWTYDRAPNQATVTLYCQDAWGLLEQYVIPGYHEFNMVSDTHTVYDLIEKLLQCIGGELSYQSRSTDMTSLYPKFEVHPGETGAGVLKRLLELVPDVIFFCGLTGYIVYPQASDSPTYSYYFPEGNQ